MKNTIQFHISLLYAMYQQECISVDQLNNTVETLIENQHNFEE